MNDLTQQERQSGRAPLHFGLSRWRRAPPLHSQSLVCAWERGSDGQQYRDARVALPIRHRQLPARRRSVALRSLGSLSAA